MKYTQSTREYKKVGVATLYGLDGPGLESRGERDFLHQPRQAVGLIKPPVQWVPILFPRSKAAGGVALTIHHHLAPMLKKE